MDFSLFISVYRWFSQSISIYSLLYENLIWYVIFYKCNQHIQITWYFRPILIGVLIQFNTTYILEKAFKHMLH